MRFKRGSKIEVLNRREMPISWRRAKIISGNGHTYEVRYDYQPSLRSKPVVERVTRKVIRPCPPPMEGVENWVEGDIVEVLDDNSWKLATILKVLSGDYYLIRLLGGVLEYRLHRSRIRVRLSWEGDEWTVIEKGPGSCADAKHTKLPASNRNQKMRSNLLQAEDDHLAVQSTATLQESHMVSQRMQKRTWPYFSSILEAYPVNLQKKRAIEKERRGRRVVQAPLLEKVDVIAYPRDTLGDKCMPASFKNRLNGYYELEKEKVNGISGCALARIPDSNDSDSDASSVGSCSVAIRSPSRFSRHYVTVPCQETTVLSSDAESFNNSGGEENFSLPSEEEVAESIHRLELYAYRCTLEALHASGPLSWEQEALLTNLRIMLHISNDEHLIELRNLISGGTGTHIS